MSVIKVVPDFMHQGSHEGLRLDDVVALRRAHPEHDVRLPAQARIVRIEQPVQLAARVARTHAANLDVDRRRREAAANLRGQRARAGGARRRGCRSRARASGRRASCARRRSGRSRSARWCRSSGKFAERATRAGRNTTAAAPGNSCEGSVRVAHHTSNRRILTSGAASTGLSSAQ